MTFTINSSLLDAIVLSVVSAEDTYGYKITQEVNNIIDISESTLYPVLRRLQKDNNLEVYDMEYLGRNRRYYKITKKGKILLDLYREEWEIYKSKVDKVFNKDFTVASEDDYKEYFESERLKYKEEKKGFDIGDMVKNINLQEKIDKLNLNDKIDSLKLHEKLEALRLNDLLDNMIANLKSDKNKTQNKQKNDNSDKSDDDENKN